jgi:elongation factor 1-beta
MGKIAATYDLMPGSTDVDLKAIIAKIPSILPNGVSIMNTEIKPVAFGLEKIEVAFLVDDADETVGTKLEEGLHSLDGIETITCFDSTCV